MNAGAAGAAAPRYDEVHEAAHDAGETGWTETIDYGQESADEGLAGRGRRLLAIVILMAAVAWIGACLFVGYQMVASADFAGVVGWIATACIPLALLILVWLAFGRTSRAETERFRRAVAELRGEADGLHQVLGVVAERLSSNRSQLGDHAARLMTLGEEASDRLGRVTHYLAREAEGLDGRARSVEAAAAQARIDLGVLLSDLPRAEQSTRSFGEAMREAGVAAHERARALEAQLSAITARAQDVDAAAGGAAERLGAHINRIETSAEVASQRLGEAARQLDSAVDAALGRTGEAVAATRTAIDVQAEGLTALVEQCRARLAETGADAGAQAERSLGEARRLVDTIGAGIAAQEQASGQLVERLIFQIGSLDERLAALGQRAEGQTSQMATALADLRDATATLRQEVDASTQEAVILVQRTGEMSGALGGIEEQLRVALPTSLADAEARAIGLRDVAREAAEPVETIRAAAADTAAKLAEAEANSARQREALEASVAGLDGGLAAIVGKLGELSQLAIEADHAIGVVVRDAGPELVETLVRVRETSRAAATHAREAIVAVIPEAVGSLTEAAREALGESVTASIHRELQELEAGSQRAAAAARAASERLTRQLLALGQSAAAIEARIDEEKARRDDETKDDLPRRTALLIEALNSTAIDVGKILSNDVTDTAWQAYLKGDRGVFTRRVVRLLGSGEAREIQRHYDHEPEFRAQVNRYIADFEALLRHVLADGDGNALAVTMLSSDMGKLYVALAQAIDHIRV